LANGNGGARPGAGRKPGSARDSYVSEELLSLILEKDIDKVEEYNYALSVFLCVMHDELKTTAERASAAREVMDRIKGRPKQVFTLDEMSDDDAAKALEPIFAKLGIRPNPPGEPRVDVPIIIPTTNDAQVSGSEPGTSQRPVA
jgi:hypothetical protein